MKNPLTNILPNERTLRVHTEKSIDSSFFFNKSGSYPVNMKPLIVLKKACFDVLENQSAEV